MTSIKTAALALWALLLLTGCPETKTPKDPTKPPIPSATTAPAPSPAPAPVPAR